MTLLRPLKARFANLVEGCIEEKIVFVHIPKCGGNSIASAIYDRYKTFDPRHRIGSVFIDAKASLDTVTMLEGSDPFEDNYLSVLRFREYLLVYHLGQKGTRYVHGHFNFSDLAYQQFGDKFAFVTVLRDPVKRWISSYFYNKYRGEDVWKIKQDIGDYIDTSRAKAQGFEYVKKLYGSLDPDIDYASSAAIAKAKANLDKFAVVGILEDLDNFGRRFRERFGVSLNIGLRNRGPKTEEFIKTVITEKVEESIRDLCWPDIEIFRHAREDFHVVTDVQ